MIFQGPLIFVVAMCRTRVAFLFKRYFCQVICSLFSTRCFVFLFSFFCQVVFSLFSARCFSLFFSQVIFSFFRQVVFSFFSHVVILHVCTTNRFRTPVACPAVEVVESLLNCQQKNFPQSTGLFSIFEFVFYVYLFPHMSKSLLNRRRT